MLTIYYVVEKIYPKRGEDGIYRYFLKRENAEVYCKQLNQYSKKPLFEVNEREGRMSNYLIWENADMGKEKILGLKTSWKENKYHAYK
jgi:hypothetical protein